MANFIPVEPEKWAEMVKAQAEVSRLKAECQARQAENSVLAVECERLKAEVERLTKAGNNLARYAINRDKDMEIKEVEAWNKAKGVQS